MKTQDPCISILMILLNMLLYLAAGRLQDVCLSRFVVVSHLSLLSRCHFFFVRKLTSFSLRWYMYMIGPFNRPQKTMGKECGSNVSIRLWGGVLCDETQNSCEGVTSSFCEWRIVRSLDRTQGCRNNNKVIYSK